MRVADAIERILAGWLRSESEVIARIESLDLEKQALVSLLRTIQAQRVVAELAAKTARELDRGSTASGSPVRSGSGSG